MDCTTSHTAGVVRVSLSHTAGVARVSLSLSNGLWVYASVSSLRSAVLCHGGGRGSDLSQEDTTLKCLSLLVFKGTHDETHLQISLQVTHMFLHRHCLKVFYRTQGLSLEHLS